MGHGVTPGFPRIAAPGTAGAAQPVKRGLFHQREADIIFPAEVLHLAGFGAAKPFLAEYAVNTLRSAGQQL